MESYGALTPASSPFSFMKKAKRVSLSNRPLSLPPMFVLLNTVDHRHFLQCTAWFPVRNTPGELQCSLSLVLIHLPACPMPFITQVRGNSYTTSVLTCTSLVVWFTWRPLFVFPALTRAHSPASLLDHEDIRGTPYHRVARLSRLREQLCEYGMMTDPPIFRSYRELFNFIKKDFFHCISVFAGILLSVDEPPAFQGFEPREAHKLYFIYISDRRTPRPSWRP